MPDLLRDQLGTYTAARADGDVVTMRVGPRRLGTTSCAIFHPGGVQHVLAGAARSYVKQDPVYGELRAWFGDGLLIDDGPHWQSRRRTLQPLFTARQVATFDEPMVAELEELLQHPSLTLSPWSSLNGTSELEGPVMSCGSTAFRSAGWPAPAVWAWQYTAIDVASSYTWAQVWLTPKNASPRWTSVLAQRVAPDLAEHGWELGRVTTDSLTAGLLDNLTVGEAFWVSVESVARRAPTVSTS